MSDHSEESGLTFYDPSENEYKVDLALKKVLDEA
jgi:hypothetical protein